MSWQTPENLSADEIVAKFTGTPDGTKFLRDDGTLAAGGSGLLVATATSADSGATWSATIASFPGLVNGTTIAVRFTTYSNATADPTLSINGGAATLFYPVSGGKGTGVRTWNTTEILPDDVIYILVYNQSNGQWGVVGPNANHLESTGGTMTGNLTMTGSNINTSGNIHFTATDKMITAGNPNGSGQFDIKCGHLRFISGGTEYQRFSTNGITFTLTAAPADYGIGRSSTPALTLRGPSSGGIECLAGSTSVQAKVGTTGIVFPNSHTDPGSAAYGICRDTGENATVVVSASSAASYLSASGGALVMAYGASHATYLGMTYLNPKAVSLANSAQRTIAASATGRSGFVEIVDLTNHRVARYSINAGVPTKDSGHAQFVAGAPGAGEVGVELSSTTLRVNNNSGGALLIAINAMLAY